MIIHQPGRRSANVDGCRLPHNTLSADKAESVRVYYPFHPLRGQELRVFITARSPDGAVTVEDAKHKRLKIPLWMVAADAARYELADEPTLNAHALVRLVELHELHRGKLLGMEGNPQMEQSHEATLVDQTANGRTDTRPPVRPTDAG